MDKKYFKDKNRNFGTDRKYVPKTNKPRPTTYEIYINNGEASYNDALWLIKDNIPELSDFINTITVSEDQPKWFDVSIARVASYFEDKIPSLQAGRNIHTKLSLDVNGFSVRLEDNISIDIHCKYHIDNGVASIISSHVMITTHGKVSKQTYEYLRDPENGWVKKMFKKKFTPRDHKEEFETEEE